MQKEFESLFNKNRNWAKRMVEKDPDFFHRLADQQHPQYLWIGCSDSRVPANQIIDSAPGEVFVHRNIANMVNHGDMNVLSVLQYSVEVLKVRHIIVCGHYSCGGVKAALDPTDHGLIDNWIRPIKKTYEDNISKLEGLSESEIVNKLCEWNVQQQVLNVAQSTILQKVWKKGQQTSIHGIIYSINDGKLVDLECSIHGAKDITAIYHVQ